MSDAWTSARVAAANIGARQKIAEGRVIRSFEDLKPGDKVVRRRAHGAPFEVSPVERVTKLFFYVKAKAYRRSDGQPKGSTPRVAAQIWYYDQEFVQRAEKDLRKLKLLSSAKQMLDTYEIMASVEDMERIIEKLSEMCSKETISG